MKYQAFTDDGTKETLVFESNDFIEMLKTAKKIAIQKVDKVWVYYNPVDPNDFSDMWIAYDPLGRRISKF